MLRKPSDVLFVKVENDGFGLGAQRRPISENDLPDALRVLNEYKQNVLKNKKIRLKESFAHLVAKKKITENDWNLTGDRYKEDVVYEGNLDLVELGTISEVSSGNSAPQENKYFDNGCFPFYRTFDVGMIHLSTNLNESKDYVNQIAISEKKLKLFPKKTILFPKSGASTFLNHRVMLGREGYVSSHLATIIADEQKINPYYLYYILCRIDAKSLTNDQPYPSLKLSQISKIKIPLPPIEVQQQIVEEIQVKQDAITHAKEVIKSLERERQYFGDSLRKLEDVKWVELGEVAEYINGFAFKPQDWKQSGKKIIRIQNLTGTSEKYNYTDGTDIPEKYIVKCNDLLISWSATIGFYIWENDDAYLNQHIFKVVLSDKILKQYFYFLQNNIIKDIIGNVHGNTMQHITKDKFEKIKIPLPPLEVQKQLVAEIEKEELIIEANKTLIDLLEKKIEKRMKDI